MHDSPLRGIANRIEAEAGFTGGPIELFEEVGRDTFVTLLQNGLRPDHRLLDLGCGGLRLGYWLVRFLDPARYFGIEPNRQIVSAGKRHALGEEVLAHKRPAFDAGAELDFGAFGVAFDYVVARSVWTHTSPAMVRTCLDQLVAHGAEGAILLTSYWPDPGSRAFLAEASAGANEIHAGEEMDAAAWSFVWAVTYRFETIAAWCAERGLRATELGGSRRIQEQAWLRIERR